MPSRCRARGGLFSCLTLALPTQLSGRLAWAQWARSVPWRESQWLQLDSACEAPVSQWAGYKAPSQLPRSAEWELGRGKTEKSHFILAATRWNTKCAITLCVLTETSTQRGSYTVIMTQVGTLQSRAHVLLSNIGKGSCFRLQLIFPFSCSPSYLLGGFQSLLERL